MVSKYTKPNKQWPQYLASILVTLAYTLNGLCSGWPSLGLVYLFSEESHIKITKLDSSIIVMITTFSAIIFTPITCIIGDKIGRKKTIIVFVVPYFIGYMIIATTSSVYMLYFARFLIGFESSLIFIPSVYITEISDNNIRGNLLSCCCCMYYLGVMLSYLFGVYLSFVNQAIVASFVCLVLLLGLILWVPESPYYYAMIEDLKSARESIKKLKGGKNIEQEIKMINENFSGKKIGFKKMLKYKGVSKAFFVACYLNACEQMCGIFPVITYSGMMFFESGFTAISPGIVGILLQSLLGICSSFGLFFTDRIGKKPLLIFSLALSALMLYIQATYYYLKDIYDLTTVSWIPFGVMCIYLAAYVVGLGNICMGMTTEFFPTEFKQWSNAIIATMIQTSIFVSLFIFDLVKFNFGLDSCFLMYAVMTTFNVYFVLKYVPETTNKSFREIYDFFGFEKIDNDDINSAIQIDVKKNFEIINLNKS